MATALPISSLFILLLAAVVLVQGRFSHGSADNQTTLDDDDDHQFLTLEGQRPRWSSSNNTCEHAYGFFPCADNIPGYLFQIVIFQYLTSLAEHMVSRSSKKIFHTLGTGIFGATVFRILMVFPRIIMTISSGIFNSKEGAQNQVFFGVRVNAGATIFNLTILWGLCVIVGRRNRKTAQESDAQSTSTQSFSSKWFKIFKECGISTDSSTCRTAGLMLLSVVPFVFVELVNVVASTFGQRIVLLLGLILTLIFLLAYFAYQIIDPRIQTRSLHYSRFESLLTQNRRSNISRIRLLLRLYDSDNNTDNNQMTALELESFLRLIVSDEVQRLDTMRKMMKDFDDNDGKASVDEQEFLNALRKLLLANSSPNDNVTQRDLIVIGNDQKKGDGSNNSAVGEIEQGGKTTAKNKIIIMRWGFIILVFKVIFGIVILTFCAQPLMNNVTQFSNAVGVPSFIISFVVLPIVINGRMAISAIFPASQKSSRVASLTFSEIYNGVIMSNLTGLLSLLAVVYVRELNWDYSAEVLVVFLVSLAIGFLAYFQTTYQLWTSIFAFFLYPFSLALFYLLQLHFVGWD